MSPATPRRRLDEILVAQGVITESQAAEALLRQRAQGGKFGSQLLYFRMVSEEQLTHALAQQLGCEGVSLGVQSIPEDVIALVPEKIALARHVIPFGYDPERNEVLIASENPTDPALMNELGFVLRGKKLRLYVAPEISITAALEKYYMGRATSLEEHLLLSLPDVTGDEGDSPSQVTEVGSPAAKPAVLFVTAEAFSAPLLQSVLEREDHQVALTESLEEATTLLTQHTFRVVFVHSSAVGNTDAFCESVARHSPRTEVRRYDSPADLILNDRALAAVGDLTVKSLDLYSSLLTSLTGMPLNHSGRVGHYAQRLCSRLDLPDTERLMITHAAFLHDLARPYYASPETRDKRELIALSCRLLASVNYPDAVLRRLQLMYADSEVAADSSFAEQRAGQILTLVDLFCESVPADERLTLDRFDTVKKRLRDLGGKLMPSDIVEAFIDIVQGEILDLQVSRRSGQVMVFAQDAQVLQPLELRLKNEGFRTVAATTIEALVELFNRSAPDLLILSAPGDADAVLAFTGELRELSVAFDRVPTLLLVERSSIAQLTPLLDLGVEDILAADTNLGFLVSKLGKLQARSDRVAASSVADDAAGARGRLADMNLIDLLQALGPSRRSVKIVVNAAHEKAAGLIVYLRAGEIHYAECDGKEGPDAVYHAIGWCEGTWSVESVAEEQIPPQNNQLSNESILMEGCRLEDERLRSGKLI